MTCHGFSPEFRRSDCACSVPSRFTMAKGGWFYKAEMWLDFAALNSVYVTYKHASKGRHSWAVCAVSSRSGVRGSIDEVSTKERDDQGAPHLPDPAAAPYSAACVTGLSSCGKNLSMLGACRLLPDRRCWLSS